MAHLTSSLTIEIMSLLWRREAISTLAALFLLLFIPGAHCAGDDQTTSVVSIVGTAYNSTKNYEATTIKIPPTTKPGDLMVMFVGGSGQRYKGTRRKSPEPGPPIPTTGWVEIVQVGSPDINQKAYYKLFADDDSTQQSYTINDGKSMFVSMVSLRGADVHAPIVEAAADLNTMPGFVGASRAPLVNTEQAGIVLASFVYDDPQRARIITPGFTTLISFRAQSADGMAVGASTTTNGGTVGPIDASGYYSEGAGNEVAIAISFRAWSPPTHVPSETPSARPSSLPSLQTSGSPSESPQSPPSRDPSSSPSSLPSLFPSSEPSAMPSSVPSSLPSLQTSGSPSESPQSSPSRDPSSSPSSLPSLDPSSEPSAMPSSVPSSLPSLQTSGSPSESPQSSPSRDPSSSPSSLPSLDPSSEPSAMPSSVPSSLPSLQTSGSPSESPQSSPSRDLSSSPSSLPSLDPSSEPSAMPSSVPSSLPSLQTSGSPSESPQSSPSRDPSSSPSSLPSLDPSSEPSAVLNTARTISPTPNPTPLPTVFPSRMPSLRGTAPPRTGNEEEEETPTTCSDGTIILGETFCYVKRDKDDGTVTRNDAKRCAFFEDGETDVRLRNHCNEDNPGAGYCRACKEHTT